RGKKSRGECGDADDFVVVGRGADKERMRAAPEAAAARLRQHPDLFDRLFYKVDLRSLRNRALMLAPYEQIEAIHRDYLADMKRLLDFGPVSWHALGLHPMIQEARQRLAALEPRKPLSARDERFPRQLAPLARVAR